MGCDCLAAHESTHWTGVIRNQFFNWLTACASAHFLLRPLSPTTARTNWNSNPISGDQTRLPKHQTSDAAVVPALVSTFDFEFTLLERVTARSVQVLAAFRQTTLSRRIANGNRCGFPPTKAEARSTDPEQFFAIRLRLLEILLASPPLRIRLGLSWLSFSPPGF